jgi:peptide/nickel transport system substrate-binding protein
MRTIRFSAFLAVFALVAPVAAQDVEVYGNPEVATPESYSDSDFLKQRVDAGELDPVEQRLPETPRVTDLEAEGKTPGKAGGDLVTLVGRNKDSRLLAVYGYARLVGYNEKFELIADIAESVEVEDGRIFTFHLRPGHRWSDGHPFTSEDFRYWWEEVATNEELYSSGPPASLLIEGERPKVTFPDEHTVRYEWSRPNPFFLPELASATPLYIYMPAHYMKQFHAKYGDVDKLNQMAEEEGVHNWASIHTRQGRLYRFDNIELPVLQPWRLITDGTAKRLIAERNPYFHRVDAAGQQLPYIDRFILQVASGALISAKTGSGESDLQGRGLNFADYTFLKQNEELHDYKVRLWRTVRGSQLALYPNFNATDPVWRELIRNVDFRRALSLAIDRHEINQVIYFGLGLEGNQLVLPDSPLYDEAEFKSYAEFDLERANELLDEIGLTERNSNGIRLLPNGEPLEIIVETAGENTEESDVLELIHNTWLQAGIKLYTKPSQREVLRNRIFSGEAIMAMWYGYENGIPTPDIPPTEYTPVRQHNYEWPMWGQHFETKGDSGEPVDMPLVQELLDLYHDWAGAKNRQERREIWERILDIHASQIFTIGLVEQVPQPVVVSNSLNNVPEEAVFNWDPGAQFGVYRPDTFWFGDDEKQAQND